MSVLLNSARDKKQKGRSKPKSKAGKEKGGASTTGTTGYQPSATCRVWNTDVNGHTCSIALVTDTMDLWCNDELIETRDNFTEDGVEYDFCLFDTKGRIVVKSSGNAKEGMTHTLTFDGRKIDEVRPK